jgi:hypothetical protein
LGKHEKARKRSALACSSASRRGGDSRMLIQELFSGVFLGKVISSQKVAGY